MMKKRTTILLLLFLLGLEPSFYQDSYAEGPVFKPTEVEEAEEEEEDGIDDEFENLLSDNPKPKVKKKKKKKKKKVDNSPIVTWGVDKEKLRNPTSEGTLVGKTEVEVKAKKGPINQGKLSNDLDESNAPKLDLAPVDWDLETSQLPPNEVPVVSEVSVILSSQNFYPRKIHLAPGREARLYFTTTNKKPAALIIERLNIQRWIAKDGGAVKENDVARTPWEFTKELSRKRLTEIIVTPRKGTYVFYDALTGARGEIVVE